MTAGSKLVADRAEHGTEVSGVSQALESLQPSLTLANGWCEFSTRLFWREIGDGRHHHGFAAA
jgi:hypothetical protein